MVFGLFLFVSVVGVIVLFLLTEEFGDPAVASTETLMAGRTLYLEHCADCHGDNLQGEVNWKIQKPDGTMPAPPHDDSGHTWHHDDELLFNYTKRGGQAMIPGDFKSGMPAFKDILKDDEIETILSFIKSRWSEKSRKVQKEISAAKR